MKNVSFIIAFVFFSMSILGQEKNDLKSYEYKNLKPWQKYNNATKLYLKDNQNKLTGPEYKNRKVWNTNKEDYKLIKIKKSERSKLTGPAYKNYRPQKSK